MNFIKKTGFIAAVSAISLTSLLVSCSSDNNAADNTQVTQFSPEPVTEAVTQKTTVPRSSYITEDFYSRLDDDAKRQTDLMTSKLPELIGSYSHIYISDLDENGRSELVLSDPGFVIYEVSEDRGSLVKTAVRDDDVPSLYPVTDKLIYKDYDNKNHFIWKSVKEVDEKTVRESDKDYTYENGELKETVLRSRLFDRYQGNFKAFESADGPVDYSAYSNIISGILFRKGYTLRQCSIGILSADDIKETEPETLKQLLSELRIFFSISDPKGKYQYTDLEGTWVKKGGYSTGTDYFQNSSESSMSIVFTPDSYQITGSSSAGPTPVSLCLGGDISTSLWYADLGENNIIKNAHAEIETDGTLVVEGTALNQSGQSVNISWVFFKEGWNYPSEVYQSGISLSAAQKADSAVSEPANSEKTENTETVPDSEVSAQNENPQEQ